jgi:hypothetical protein
VTFAPAVCPEWLHLGEVPVTSLFPRAVLIVCACMHVVLCNTLTSIHLQECSNLKIVLSLDFT